MKNKKLEKCISELNLPIEERNEKIIIDYLKTLEPLMTSIKEKSENSEEIIKKLPPLMTYQKFNKNDIIYEYGQKIADIYLILNGNVTIITPKIKEYYMNEEEFIIYLLKLRKNNQKELLNLCIKYNAGIFSFNSELLSDFLFNLEKNRKKIGDIFNNEKIIDEAYDVIKSMRLKRNINNKKIKNYSPEKYLSLSDIDEEIKINSEKIKNKDSHENSKESIENERKLVKLIMYEQISILNKGEIFGDNMIESINSKMNQTIISLSDCDLVKINKINYNDLMKGSLAKLKNKFYNLILLIKYS
jgi:CRP-like cAMP-binding protein